MRGEMTREQVSASIKDEVQFAVFKAGGEEYAIDIMRIIEIIRPMKVTRVPKSPEFIRGIINLRGRVVPVLDVRERFGLGVKDEDKRTRVVIVRFESRIVGLVVDEVTEVPCLSREEVDEAPDTVKGAGAEYLSGVGKVGDRLIIILDTGKLLTREEARGLGEVERAALETQG